MPQQRKSEIEPVAHGTQSIGRATHLLRIIASRGRRGIRLQEIFEVSGLSYTTCQRMLKRLEVEEIVFLDPLTKKYSLGPFLHELGMLSRPRSRLREICDAPLVRLAEKTGDTVYLSELSGTEAVCTNRALGRNPFRVADLDVGLRRPLGVGSGGLAILANLPQAEIDQILSVNLPLYKKYGQFDEARLFFEIESGRARGYSLIGAVEAKGFASVSVAFPHSHPIAAFSVAAMESRFDEQRIEEVVKLMQDEVRIVTEVIHKAHA